MYAYSFDPVAAVEYEETFLWYQQNSIVAADAFVDAMNEAINSICKTPKLYRNTYNTLREIHLKRFPFCLIYEVDDEKKQVVIISIFHQSRNPDEKYGDKNA